MNTFDSLGLAKEKPAILTLNVHRKEKENIRMGRCHTVDRKFASWILYFRFFVCKLLGFWLRNFGGHTKFA